MPCSCSSASAWRHRTESSAVEPQTAEDRHLRGQAGADGRTRSIASRTRCALSRRAPRADAALRDEPGQGRRAQRVAPQPRIVERHGAAGRGKGSRLRRELRRHRAFPSGREHDGGTDRVDRERRSRIHVRQIGRVCEHPAAADEGPRRRQTEEHVTAGRRNAHDVQRPAGHRHRAGQPAGRLRAAVQLTDRLYVLSDLVDRGHQGR